MPNPTNTSFNGYALQNSSFVSQVIQHTQAPDRIIQVEPRARDDGGSVVSALYSQRVITITGKLFAATQAALDAKIDELKQNLSGVASIEGTLDIDFNGTTRRYIATVQKLEIPEDFYNITFIPYTVEFLCSTPFGRDTASGIVNFPGKTGQLNFTVTVSGTYASKPAFKLTVNSATSFNLISVINVTRNETINVSPTAASFSPGDVVVIDSSVKRVYVNGSGLDYSGIFPQLNPGANNFTINITAGAVNYDLTLQNMAQYL